MRRLATIGLMPPNSALIPPIDTARRAGKIFGMVRKLIESAMRSTIQELVTPQFESLSLRMNQLEGRVDRSEQKIDALGQRLEQKIEAQGQRLEQKIEAQGQRLEQKIDAQGQCLEKKIEALGERLDQRLDGVILSVTAQGGRLDKRIDGAAERLDRRLEEFSLAQGRLVEEVAALKRD